MTDRPPTADTTRTLCDCTNLTKGPNREKVSSTWWREFDFVSRWSESLARLDVALTLCDVPTGQTSVQVTGPDHNKVRGWQALFRRNPIILQFGEVSGPWVCAPTPALVCHPCSHNLFFAARNTKLMLEPRGSLCPTHLAGFCLAAVFCKQLILAVYVRNGWSLHCVCLQILFSTVMHCERQTQFRLAGSAEAEGARLFSLGAVVRACLFSCRGFRTHTSTQTTRE